MEIKSLEKMTLEEKRALAKELLKKKLDEQEKQKGEHRSTLTYPPLVKRGQEKEYALASAQYRLYLLESFESFRSLAYNLPAFYIIEGKVDTARAIKAFQAVVDKYDILRTSFKMAATGPVQQVHQQVSFTLEEATLSGDEENREAKITQEIKAFIRPFDFEKPPLMRVKLLYLSQEKYLIFFDIHHVIADAQSIRLLMNDYLHAFHGQTLKPLMYQYQDYVAWQEEFFKHPKLQEQEKYWLARFKDQPVLDFPADYQRPDKQQFAGNTLNFILNAKQAANIEAISKRFGTTYYITFMALFGIMLQKYAGQEDIVIGSPVAGRPLPELQPMIGMFVNNLAIRLAPERQRTFAVYMEDVKRICLEALEHQDYPYSALVSALVEKCVKNRELSRNPLFDVMFVWQSTDTVSLAMKQLKVMPYNYELPTSPFDIVLEASKYHEQFQLKLKYATSLYKPETMVRFKNHLLHLIEQADTIYEKTLGMIDLFDETEKELLLYAFNRTQADYPSTKTLVDLFEAAVFMNAQREALTCNGKTLTYRELNVRVNRLAHCLKNQVLPPEAIVGILLDRSLEMVICILAVLKAGGTYMPLDPDYPDDRLQFMLDDSEAALLITSQAYLERIAFTRTVINLDATDLMDYPADNLQLTIRPEQMAYIIYTSGTTGKPKGVIIEHRNVVRLLFNEQNRFDFNEQDVWTMFHSPCFDFSVWEMYGALLYGGKVIVVPKTIAVDTTAFLTLVRQEKVTILNQTPSAFYQFIHEVLTAQASDLALRMVIFGGESLKPIQLKIWHEFYPLVKLINMYGITETTVHVTYKEITEYEINANLNTTGGPIPTTTTYIMDKTQKLVPIGVVGEICVGGSGVGRGYLKRDALTKQKFVSNPYLPHERLYRSGDLARRLPDGDLVYMGRIDNQIQLRGFRVELGEIEARLAEHEMVREAAVVPSTDQAGDLRIIAYFVTEEEEKTESLRQFLREKLPDYMLPAAFIKIDRMPLTSNGKVDQKALPAPDWQSEHEFVAPATELEKKLAGIWSVVLHQEQIGIYDNFFELGGHSLLATQIFSRIRSELNVELPLTTLFENQTIYELTRCIESQQKVVSMQKTQQPVIVPQVFTDEIPLSFAQVRLWFIDQLEPNSATYNIPFVMKLTGKLDVLRWEQALQMMSERHVILRMTITVRDGKPVQKINPQFGMEFSIERLDTNGHKMQNSEIENLVIAEGRRPFHLADGPLWRAKLFVLNEQENVFILTMHHIISDAWTIGIFLQELAALYQGAKLPPLTVQYADFAYWQQQRMKDDDYLKQLDYWKEQLSGELPVIELPVDYPRPQQPTYVGKSIFFKLPEKLHHDLRLLCKQEDVTLYMLLLAAFKLLLHKYSSLEDIIVGTPIANRNLLAVENIIGFFVNTLVLRTGLSSDIDFKELLRRVRHNTLQAYANQDIPFEKLVDEVQPERHLNHNPIFHILFSLQNIPKPDINLPGLQVDIINGDIGVTHFDLTMDLEETANGISGKLEYNTVLFSEETIWRLSKHFEQLLTNIVTTPSARLSDLSLLTEAEQKQLLITWNQTERGYREDACLQELFEEQAAKRPEAIVLVAGCEEVSYQQLNEEANRLARYLQTHGVRAGSLVGVCLNRNRQLLVSLLAILKAGGAYVPLDPGFPRERLQLIVEDSGPALILSERDLAEVVPVCSHPVLTVEELAEVVSGYESCNLPRNWSARERAYVLFTSGSTGRPKGVEIEQRSVVNFLMAMQAEPGFNESDRLLAVTTISFDISVLELFLPLVSGGRVVLLSRESAGDAAAIKEALEEQGITVMQSTPSTWQMLEHAGWQGKADLRVLCGGEVFPPALAGELVQKCREVWNMYGPTETTIWSTLAKVERGAAERLTIGRPLSNTEAYVLDKSLQPVPVGVRGELYLGGAGVSRGYLNREDLTKECFIAHPFKAGKPGQPSRLYRTGDACRYLADGRLEFLGRLDNQVKLRGYRIELGEIESCVSEQAGIKQAVVVLREDEPGYKQLVAYYVREAGTEVRETELREALRASLPEYMLPAFFMELAELPLTANRKLDRRALPIPGYQGEEEYLAPRDQKEEVLVMIWEEVLKQKPVGVRDNFFQRGGHSLLATQLVSRIRAELGVELPVRIIFERPTVAGLAEELAGRQKRKPYTAIKRVSRTQPLPLSFAQERLWVIDQLEPGNTAYNIPVAVRLKGAIDAGRLEESLNALIARHEVLRTTFKREGDKVYQMPASVWQLTLERLDVSRLSAEEREGQVKGCLEEEVQSAFNLASEPLVRAKLIKLAAEEYIFVYTMHHIISDGWSTGVFVRELLAALGGERLGELEIQYADFAVWQREWLKGEVLEEQLGYWKEQLAGELPVLELPLDKPRPPRQSYGGAAYAFDLGEAEKARVEALSWETGSTPYMVLLAAFNVLLAKYANQEDIIVGTPIANRNRKELEGLIGFFVNTLAIRTDLTGNPTVRELLARVKETMLGAYEHQDLPFEKLVEELQPERDMSRSPLFQVMFILQNALIPEINEKDFTVQPVELDVKTSQFDMTLTFIEEAKHYAGAFNYNTDLFSAETVQQLARHFKGLLEQLISSPDQRLSELSLLSEEEKEELMAKWNRTEQTYEAECVHRLFEAQAALSPEALAVVDGRLASGQSLTYRELNVRANQLAHYLLEQGVKPRTLVGLCLERSEELLVALLAVLKTGAAYVPLDPTYPASCLALMLEDSRPVLLFTQKALVKQLPPWQGQLLCYEEIAGQLESQAVSNPALSLSASSRAYVIFTSGSTGRPKGIAMSHRALSNLLAWQREEFCESGSERVLQYASLNFDVSFQEIFSTLGSGRSLVLVGEDERKDLNQLLNLLIRERVNRLFLPAIALHYLAEQALAEKKYPVSLKEIITAGDVLKITPAVYQFFKRLPECRFYNHYGPSETHVVSRYCLKGDVAAWPVYPPIGEAISNTRLYLVDKELRLVPTGVAGELLIGGVCLADGYINQAGLTAEKFIELSLRAGAEKERVYRTGDLVRRQRDGQLVFVGRADEQVKIRGFRVELKEIEAVLSRQEAVKACVVVAREDKRQQKRLVAYIVSNQPEIADAAALKAALQQELPEYMVPALYVFLEQLPFTPSGKLDTRGLPEPVAGSELEQEYLAPRSREEAELVAIWQEVLGVERIGVHDNFFALGGHSLLATQVISRLHARLGVELPLRVLFETGSVARLAEAVEQAARSRAGQAAPGLSGKDNLIPRADRSRPIPLSFAQQRLWFIDKLTPGNTAYNIPMAVRLKGPINALLLEEYLNTIIERHEILRTTFCLVDGQPSQVIAERLLLKVEELDLSGLPEGEREKQAKELVAEKACLPFELAHAPLIRCHLFKLNDIEHIFLLNMHHIISDGWSTGTFLKELMDLYHGENPLAEMRIQYADFAVWQRDWMQHEILDEQIHFWKKELSGELPVLDLPTDYPRPAMQTFQGEILYFDLAPEASRTLLALTQSSGTTLYMLLFAAYNILLQKYSGQDDIIVGTPIANRNRLDIENLIGFFVNTLAIRIDLSEDPSFSSLVEQVRRKMIGAYDHQDLPFEKLVDELKIPRDLSRTPLFQTMFILQNTVLPELHYKGLDVEMFDIEGRVAHFDLTWTFRQAGQNISGFVEYNTDLFKQSTIRKMIGHFQNIINTLCAQPEVRISSLEWLDKQEMEQLLYDWNQAGKEYSSDLCLHVLFEKQVRKTPNHKALAYEEQQLTYAELNTRANQLAHYLLKKGLQPHELVGICTERSPEMIIAIWGILKAGGGYLPLDPAYPTERLAYMMKDSQAKFIFTQSHLMLDMSQTVKSEFIYLDRITEQLLNCSPENPVADDIPGEVTPASPAYIIYTSGSTGKPKGVLLAHRGACHLQHVHAESFAIGGEDKVLQFASLSFDASFWEITMALLNGAVLILAPKDKLVSHLGLAEVINQNGVTLTLLPPTMLEKLSTDLPSLRCVISGGEKCSRLLVRKWADKVDFFNAYGPTENTVCSTMELCRVSNDKAPAIGRPLGNVTCYILDKFMQPVPVGVKGELFVGGPQLGIGYLNRPELTAERFITHPFSNQPGARLYKTGDSCRYLEDGRIDFLGRLDNQVKMRGYRIELGEIEETIMQHPDVKDALVLMREDITQDKRLVAYLVTEAIDKEQLVQDLRLFVKNKLPDYMLPAAWLTLDAFPLTPNSKIDRRALPAPVWKSGSFYAPPVTILEQELVRIWEDVLGVKPIGIDDNFFELGGHSLSATQVVARIETDMQKVLPLRAFFESGTIHALAKKLDSEGQQGCTAIGKADRKQRLPLSFAQERLWFIDRFEPGNAAYNIPLAVRLEGAIGREELQKQLNRIVARHEVLRTTFRLEGKEAVQEPAEELCINIEEVDVSGCSEEACQERIRSEAERAFDLSKGPLLRVYLFKLAAEEQIFLLNMHHIISDGWSTGVLVRELLALLQGKELPPLKIQYADFAVWQKEWLKGEVLEEQLAYWKGQLSGELPVLDLVTDYPRPPVQTFRGNTLFLELSEELKRKLVRQSQETGSTLYMVLLAAFNVLLGQVRQPG